MKKLFTVMTTFALTAVVLAGCSGTDVVLKYSPGSFKHIVDQYPNIVTESPMANGSMTDSSMANLYYTLTVDGETVLKISHDYQLSGSNDIMIETPLKPFKDAGLDVSKLGDGYLVKNGMLYLTADYGNGTGMKNTMTDSLFDSVNNNRSVLTYHQKLDHYGIKLPAGKFEWAKDSSTNDKDVVFVIKAQPLKELGVDVEHIYGWTFATVQESDGSNLDVLLKPYDLGSK